MIPLRARTLAIRHPGQRADQTPILAYIEASGPRLAWLSSNFRLSM
jgi:hypothetical protein